MKKTVFLVILCTVVMGVSSCSDDNNSQETHVFIDGKDGAVGTFSYDRYLSRLEWSGGITKDPSEFVNITETKIKTKEKAIELAKNEVTIKYELIDVYYDKKKRIWAILFRQDYINGYVFGGGQSVFINNNGITQLVTYGE